MSPFVTALDKQFQGYCKPHVLRPRGVSFLPTPHNFLPWPRLAWDVSSFGTPSAPLLQVLQAGFSTALGKVKSKVKAVQSCLMLCDPMDCSLPGFSVHGILQARILQWVAFPFSRVLSQPRDRTLVFCIAGGFFHLNHWGSPKDRSWYPSSIRARWDKGAAFACE